ncbi:hypothetical protein [uncultured Campylobacter sp.]|uniref:hypothetical protein n=1 Tax=uncultured Campylobacter sp. TaxID=218934 RepID=UPI0026258D07|nr:hypothetical protein [uncultured Campylobacter sp.]
MSEKSLEIFKLCEKLTELLQDKEAIADLELLFKRHPEMFKDIKEVKELIDKVVSEPDIIINNPSPRSEKDYIVGKKLNDEKMGEVGIRKDENISKIFHANEKRLKNLKSMAKKEVLVDGRDAHTSYTQAQSLDGRLVQKNISSTNENILTNSTYKSQAKSREQNFYLKDTLKCLKILKRYQKL